MYKYIYIIRDSVGPDVIEVFDNEDFRNKHLSDIILSFFELVLINRDIDDEENYYAAKLNDFNDNKEYKELIDFANMMPSKFRKTNITFICLEVKHVITNIKPQSINNVDLMRANNYANLLNQTGNVIVVGSQIQLNLNSGYTSSSTNNNSAVNSSSSTQCVKSSGATCRNCKTFNEYAEPDSNNGTMICSGCKIWSSIV